MVSRTLWRLRARRPGGGGIGFGFELNVDQNCTVFNFLVNEGERLSGRAAIGRREGEGAGRNFLDGVLRKLRVQAGGGGGGRRSAGRLVGLDGHHGPGFILGS